VKYRIRGQVIEVSDPLTDEQIEAIARDIDSLYGTQDRDVPTPENLAQPEPLFPAEGPRTMSFGETAVESLPTLAGGGMGMAGMAMGGPVLAVPFAAAGGVGGQMAKDIIQGEPFDFSQLISQGLLQASFEAGGTLVVNAAGKILKYAPDTLRALGITANIPAEEAAAMALRFAPEAGTPESRLSTQQILQEGVAGSREGERITGTLSRSQAGQISPLGRVLESLGEIGIFGQSTFKQNDENIETILQTRLNEVLQGLSNNVRSTSEIGELFTDTLNSARTTLSNSYGATLEKLQANFRTGMVDTTGMKEYVKGLLERSRRGSESGKYSVLEDATITEYRRILDLPDEVSGDVLLETFKVLSQKSAGMLEKGAPGFNSVASGQLTKFITEDLKPFVNNQLQKINSQAFKEYEALNSNYSRSTNLLSPSMLKVVARRGKSEDFSGVGSFLTETNNPDVVKKAYNALLEAKKINKDLNVLEATDALRQGYLQKLIGGETRDLSQVVQAATALKKNPKKMEVFKEVLGASAPGVQKLMNAAYDASQKPQVGVLGLMLRGKESQSIQLMLSGAIGYGGTASDVALAVGVLGAPRLFAKFALNSKAVDKLLQLDRAAPRMAPKLILSNLTRIANEAGINLEEEMANELRRFGEAQSASEQVQAVTQ